MKRIANVPRPALAIYAQLSKADLMEAAWHLASLCNETGCDDEEATLNSLVSELNTQRARRGARPLNLALKARLSAEEHEAYLANVERVKRELREFYTDDEVLEWLGTPQRLLGGESPHGKLLRGDIDSALAIIHQLKDGAFA